MREYPLQYASTDKNKKSHYSSSAKCLISVKIAILTPHLHRRWWMFGWYLICRNMSTDCVFLEVNPCFQRAHVFCMDLQPAADPYNVVCSAHIWLYAEE